MPIKKIGMRRFADKLRSAFLVHMTALVALACASAENATDRSTEFRVALLTPGPVSDQSWNSAAYSGLERIRDTLGAEISHIQTRTPAEFEENFRQYGAKGYALVIGHGFEYQDAAQRVAPEYPKTTYVTTGGTGVGPNIAALSFAFNEPSYLAGMAAAAVSKTGILGTIGGTALPPVAASFTAFEAGARAVRPDIKVLGAFIGNWDDAGAGKEQALAQIARRADVIFQNADAAGLGVFQAVRESKGVWVIGANADQNALAPSVTLGSVVIDLPLAFALVAQEVRSGTFAPRVVRFDTATGVVRWVPNPGIAVISASMLARLDSTRILFAEHRFLLPPGMMP